VLQFVCDVVNDTGKEVGLYLRPLVRIGLDCLVPSNFGDWLSF